MRIQGKKSTTDIIFCLKTEIYKKNEPHGQILFDLTKAFDKINRNKLWNMLYEKGLPIILIQIINGHINNLLCCKIGNNLNKTISNNVGVFQGSPLSPLLFTISRTRNEII